MKLINETIKRLEIQYRNELCRSAMFSHRKLRWPSLKEIADLLRIEWLQPIDDGRSMIVPGAGSGFIWRLIGERLVGTDNCGAYIELWDGSFTARTRDGRYIACYMCPGSSCPRQEFFYDDHNYSIQHAGLTGAAMASAMADRIFKAIHDDDGGGE